MDIRIFPTKLNICNTIWLYIEFRYCDHSMWLNPHLLNTVSDANGREEAGQLSGNLFYDGDVGSCDKVLKLAPEQNPAEGKYCMVWWHLINEVLWACNTAWFLFSCVIGQGQVFPGLIHCYDHLFYICNWSKCSTWLLFKTLWSNTFPLSLKSLLYLCPQTE